MDKLITIPKEKHIHRMKNGTRFTLPLNKQEIIKLLKDRQWNVDNPESLQDLIDIIRAVEKIHGIV